MQKFTPQEFHEIRNTIFNDLVLNNVIKENDNTFQKLDFVLGNVLSINWEDAKIPIKEVTICWAEGDNSKYDKFPKTYNSITDVDKALMPIYEDIAKDYIGGYNKVKFIAIFEDNERYEGRLSVSPSEDNPYTTNYNVIGAHIKSYLNWLINNNLEVEEATKFLNKYEL